MQPNVGFIFMAATSLMMIPMIFVPFDFLADLRREDR